MRKVITIIAVLAIIICLAGITYFNVKQNSFKNDISSLEEKIDTSLDAEGGTGENSAIDFSQLTALNSDIVAWVRIEDTGISYPVMQNNGGSEYYMYRNFKKEEDPNGLPFLDIRNSPLLLDDSMIIYGHNMKTGLMFHDLERYQDKEYFDKHSIIALDTPTGRRSFQIFAVLKEKISSDFSFNYNMLINFESQQEKDAFIADALGSSLHSADVTVRNDAALLTLSTCDNITLDGRIAIVAYETTSS